MKKQLYLIILFFMSLNASSQTIMNKDSLLHLLKSKKDTALVHLYINIGQQYEGNKIDSAKYYYLAAKDLSTKIGYKKGIIKFIANYTYVLNLEGKYEASKILNQKALKIALQLKDNQLIGNSYGNLGASYQYLKMFDLSIQNYLIAEKYYSKINFLKLGTLCSNIGNLYKDINQFEKSIQYHNKAIKIAKKNNLKNDLAIALCNKSNPLIELKKYSEAEKVLLESLKLSKEVKNEYAYSVALINMCGLITHTFKYNEIKKYADEALAIATKMNNPEGIIIAQKGLGIYYFHQKKYTEAKFHTNQSLKIAKEYESLDNQYKAYALLSNIATAEQKLTLADRYKITADSIETIINLDEVQNKVEEVKGKYEADKKALQIKSLMQQNELQDLKIKRRLWITILLLLTLFGLVGFAYSQYLNFKTKKTLLLTQQDIAIAQERLRIASDMHDDVGSGLSRIRYIVGAISRGQTEQKQGLIKVTEISDDAVQKMKEIIWSLNENNQNLEDLIYYIRGQISEMVENGNVNFVCHLPEKIPAIFFGWKLNRNTYLLVKEAVNNALKHANAQTITLNFSISNDLLITVIDNGNGFDSTKNFTGNGLNNYKKRISDLNGNYNLQSEIGVGTIFSFHLPLKV